jgi:hypothetical protein
MGNSKMPLNKLPPVIHTLEDLSFAQGEALDLNGNLIHFLRMIISSQRQDASGVMSHVVWPDLFLEPRLAKNFALEINSALAKFFPEEHPQSQPSEPDADWDYETPVRH